MRQIYKVERVPHGEKFSGKNWLVADFGVDAEDSSHYYLTTNQVHASEVGYITGTAKEECEFCAEALNEAYNKSLQGELFTPTQPSDKGE